MKVLVGNKSDMEQSRKITPEQGHEKSSHSDMSFYETSASTSFESVQKVFQDVAKQLAE